MKGATYVLTTASKGAMQVCYNRTITYESGLWRVENPLMSSLPLFVLQMVTIMFINRIVMLALKPFHQPRIVANILGGVLLGPSLIGRTNFLRAYVFPFSTMLSTQTLANLGIVYYMFFVGLDLDFKPIIGAGKKTLSIALVGIVFAVPLGWALYRFLFFSDFTSQTKNKPTVKGPIFWGIALATTNFADLARILADFKLFHTEIGRLALSAAVISDLFSWFLLLVTMAIINEQIYTVLSTLAFIGLCVFVVRPALSWVIRCTTKEDSYNELHICFVLAGIVLCGFITDACGSHSMVGPFVLGAIMPRGDLNNVLLKRVGNFVSEFLMSLFFLVIGLRTNTRFILNQIDRANEEQTGTTIYRFLGVIIVAFLAKVVSTFVIALINKIPPRDSLALGLLMNTKGLLALLVLNVARDLKVLDNQTFAVMIVVCLVMMVPIGPFLSITYKSTRRVTQYKLRNIQSVGPNTEIRILACTHTSCNITGMISLLEASNPTKQSPISVFAVQLVELIGHSSAMLIVHDACRTDTDHTNEVQSDFNSNAFENYVKQRENVFVQALTVVSPYNTMYEDICNLAEDKCLNLIIIPFHKQFSINGGMEDSNPSLKKVNNDVIANAPCSVAIFVDRGLATSKITDSNNSSVGCYHIAMLFIGGADDREALAYAWRMAGHPRVNLTVVRLIPSKYALGVGLDADDNDEILEAMATTGRQKQLDDLYMDEFRLRSMNNPSIKLLEKLVNSWEETLNLISVMEVKYDLYLVGRGRGPVTTVQLLDCDDSDDLGPLGDALVSSSFMANTSILIVKHYDPMDEVKAEEKY